MRNYPDNMYDTIVDKTFPRNAWPRNVLFALIPDRNSSKQYLLKWSYVKNFKRLYVFFVYKNK